MEGFEKKYGHTSLCFRLRQSSGTSKKTHNVNTKFPFVTNPSLTLLINVKVNSVTFSVG